MPNTPRRSFNPKRALAYPTPPQAELIDLAERVGYTGNPEHKRKPGDFGLSPPSAPRADKTLCEGAGIDSRAAALSALRDGVRKGLISQQRRGGFPQNIWSVTGDRIALEAQLENSATGSYHGYPVRENDPFRETILSVWKNQ